MTPSRDAKHEHASAETSAGSLSRLGEHGELNEEIRHHIVERAESLVADGWDPRDAMREAERLFGEVVRLRRQMADVRRGTLGWRIMRIPLPVLSQLRYAWRAVSHSKTYLLAVVTTLALGLGAASSIFSVLDALLLRPMPYHEASRLMELNRSREDGSYSMGLTTQAAAGWREASTSFADGWLAYSWLSIVRTDGSAPEELSFVAVTPGADTLLRLPMLVGRSISEEDARPGAPPVVVLSREYYERMGADRDLVGRTIQLESGPATVVGVFAGGVRFPQIGDPPDAWLPLRDDFTAADRTLLRGVPRTWVRLRPGLSLAAAQEQVDRLAVGLQEADPQPGGWSATLVPIGSHRANPDVRRAVWTLAATVAAIFLIALVNGVNLTLIRTSVRSRELAIRAAIGASRRQLFGMLLTEGLMLGLLSGVAAVALSLGALTLIRAAMPYEVSYFSPHAFHIEGRTLLFIFVSAMSAGTVLGLLPAVRILRKHIGYAALVGKGSDQTRGRRRVHDGLVAAQVALSMMLLVGAGLLVRSFVTLTTEDPGFDHEAVAMADVSLSPARYPTAADRATFLRQLEQRLEARPGVLGVTISNGTGFSFGFALQAEGDEPLSDQPTLLPHTSVAEDYFDVLGVELVAGRAFGPEDAGTDAVIIDRDMARLFWGGQNSIGRRFRFDEGQTWYTVIGVVGELRLMGRDQRDGPSQILFLASDDAAGSFAQVAVRAAGDPRAVLPVIREVMLELDPRQSIWKLRTAADALAEEEAKPRFLVLLSTLLAALSVILAAVGLFGVLTYSVTRRERELGVRMALGADRRRLRASVVREGVTITAAGVLLGLAGVLLGARALAPLLYELEPTDPATLAAAAAAFLGIAAAASFLPAQRATHVNPVEVLRSE